MSNESRANVVSSFVAIKGALIEETYAALRQWDFAKSADDNFELLQQTNAIGAKSANWLRDVVRAIRRRLDLDHRDRTLVTLAVRGCPLETWKPLLLWHMTRDDFLLRDFLVNWLYQRFREGAASLRADHVLPYLAALPSRGVPVADRWSETTSRRVANGLLKIVADFGLLRGTATREFAAYQLPEPSFLYLLHAMLEQTHTALRVLDAPDWRMYLMSRGDVETELLRLHQFRKVQYQAAGSLIHLQLPCPSTAAYTERLVA